MHKDLEAWLDQVWKGREHIIGKSPSGHSGRGVHLGDGNPAIWEVYHMYNASEQAGPTSSDDSAVAGFIDQLDLLEKATGSAAILQISNDTARLNRGQLSNVKAAPIKVTTDKQKEVMVSKKTVGKSFVHFQKDANLIVKHRVYLNVQRTALGAAFHAMTKSIWGEAGLSSAKVTGPMAAARADSVVIYLDDKPRDGVMKKLKAYYDSNIAHFGGATPKLTVPADGMPGVALGMEPPGVAVIRSGGEYYQEEMDQSFGFYRAMLIFMALDRTRWTVTGQGEPQRCDAFKRRAVKYFLRAGIDPDRPAEQSPPQNLKDIDQLARTIEGEQDEDGDYKPGAKIHIKH